MIPSENIILLLDCLNWFWRETNFILSKNKKLKIEKSCKYQVLLTFPVEKNFQKSIKAGWRRSFPVVVGTETEKNYSVADLRKPCR